MIPLDGQVARVADRRGRAADGTPRRALAPTTLLIASRADAARLRASLTWPVVRPPPALIAVPALEGPKRLRAELALNAALRDCGCTAGSAVLIVAVLGYVALLRLAPAAAPSGAYAWLAAVVVALVAGMVGKGAGLLLARARLLRRLRALELRLPD